MKIWMFNHYAQGPELPGGTRHYDLACALARTGHDVSIFAAGFHYTLLKETHSYDGSSLSIEYKNSVRFVWVKTYPYQVNNWKRMLNIISYAWRLRFGLSGLGLERPDIILGSTVHPFAAWIAGHFAERFRVPFVYEIRDLWPQTLIDMGAWQQQSLTSRFFYHLEKISVKKAAGIVVLSPLTVDYLTARYDYDPERILLLPNGVDARFLEVFEPPQRQDIPFHVTYLGGIDTVHGLDFLVDLAGSLREEPSIVFDIYGDGKERARLMQRCRDEGLSHVRWHGSVTKTEVPPILQQADALFVSTGKVLYGSENKLYEYMASAVPVLIAAEGVHNNPVKTIQCGAVLDRNDIAASKQNLLAFSRLDVAVRKQMGHRGRAYVAEHRVISRLAKGFEKFLSRMA